MAKQTAELWVGTFIKNQKAGIHTECESINCYVYSVAVSAEPGVCLKDSDIMVIAQQIGGA